jgi:RNA polymerase sigma factor (sigma-70 family)
MATRPEDRGPAFPSTQWSRILAREGARDLDALARAYWRPIQAYLSARLRVGEDAAADLAQEAFAWMLETRFLDRADPARGRFRGLLKTALARFALEHLRKQSTEKRGGGRTTEPIDAQHDRADAKGRAPEDALDDAWRRELIERARERLETELEAGGRRTYYLVFRDYFLDEGEDDALDYAALATRYGIAKTDVSNWLDYAKRRFREILRAMVVETVSDEETLREELRWLFGPEGAKGPAQGRP